MTSSASRALCLFTLVLLGLLGTSPLAPRAEAQAPAAQGRRPSAAQSSRAAQVAPVRPSVAPSAPPAAAPTPAPAAVSGPSGGRAGAAAGQSTGSTPLLPIIAATIALIGLVKGAPYARMLPARGPLFACYTRALDSVFGPDTGTLVWEWDRSRKERESLRHCLRAPEVDCGAEVGYLLRALVEIDAGRRCAQAKEKLPEFYASLALELRGYGGQAGRWFWGRLVGWLATAYADKGPKRPPVQVSGIAPADLPDHLLKNQLLLLIGNRYVGDLADPMRPVTVVAGPSGCGKTRRSLELILRGADEGEIPLVLMPPSGPLAHGDWDTPEWHIPEGLKQARSAALLLDGLAAADVEDILAPGRGPTGSGRYARLVGAFLRQWPDGVVIASASGEPGIEHSAVTRMVHLTGSQAAEMLAGAASVKTGRGVFRLAIADDALGYLRDLGPRQVAARALARVLVRQAASGEVHREHVVDLERGELAMWARHDRPAIERECPGGLEALALLRMLAGRVGSDAPAAVARDVWEALVSSTAGAAKGAGQVVWLRRHGHVYSGPDTGVRPTVLSLLEAARAEGDCDEASILRDLDERAPGAAALAEALGAIADHDVFVRALCACAEGVYPRSGDGARELATACAERLGSPSASWFEEQAARAPGLAASIWLVAALSDADAPLAWFSRCVALAGAGRREAARAAWAEMLGQRLPTETTSLEAHVRRLGMVIGLFAGDAAADNLRVRSLARQAAAQTVLGLSDEVERTLSVLGPPGAPAVEELNDAAGSLPDHSEAALAVYALAVRYCGEPEGIELRRALAEALCGLGQALCRLGRYEEAVAAYEEVLLRFAEDADSGLRRHVAMALVSQGVALGRSGRDEEALAPLGRLLDRFSGDEDLMMRRQVARALTNQGVALGQLGRHEERLAITVEALHRFDGDEDQQLRRCAVDALVFRGVALGQLGRDMEASAAYGEVLARFRDDPDPVVRQLVARALVNYGAVLARFGRDEEALVANAEVVDRFGQDKDAELRNAVAVALVNESTLLGKLGRDEERLAICGEVMKRFGGDEDLELRRQVAKALTSKAVTLGRLGRTEEALADCLRMVDRFGGDEDLELRRQVARTLTSKGVALDHLGRGDEALASWDEAAARLREDSDGELRSMACHALHCAAHLLADERPPRRAIRAIDRGLAIARRGPQVWEEIVQLTLLRAHRLAPSEGVAEPIRWLVELEKEVGAAAPAEHRGVALSALVDACASASGPKLQEYAAAELLAVWRRRRDVEEAQTHAALAEGLRARAEHAENLAQSDARACRALASLQASLAEALAAEQGGDPDLASARYAVLTEAAGDEDMAWFADRGREALRRLADAPGAGEQSET